MRSQSVMVKKAMHHAQTSIALCDWIPGVYFTQKTRSISRKCLFFPENQRSISKKLSMKVPFPSKWPTELYYPNSDKKKNCIIPIIFTGNMPFFSHIIRTSYLVYFNPKYDWTNFLKKIDCAKYTLNNYNISYM